MARLPFTDNWNEELIDRRLDFLSAAAVFVPPGTEREVPFTDRTEEHRNRVTNVRALLMAGDLALATDRTSRARDAFRAATRALTGTGSEFDAVLPGVLSGDWSLNVTQWGIQALSPAAIRARTDLLFAAIGSPDQRLDRLREIERPLDPDGLALGEPLIGALAVFGIVRDADRGIGTEERFQLALQSLVGHSVQWAEELRLHRRDTYHWQQARPGSSLVDLRRLSLERALAGRPEAAEFRSWRADQRPMPGLAGNVDVFVRKLASEILEARL